MKILQYWKKVEIFGGIEKTLVPVTEVTSEQGFFNETVDAVRASDLSFVLLDRREVVEDYRE